MKLSLPSLSSFFSPRAPSKCTAVSAADSRPSSSTATIPSGASAKKRRPSLFFQAFFLCLAVAGAIALFSEEEGALDPRVEGLLDKGWQWHDGAPCAGLKPGSFYEVEGGEASFEFLFLGHDRALSPADSWPEAPRTCAPILEPSHIQELL